MAEPATAPEAVLFRLLESLPHATIACSGGIDSMLLSVLAGRLMRVAPKVAHVVSPAVPAAATARVKEWARSERWDLALLSGGEFGDERYLANPTDRCYYCKSHLYAAVAKITPAPLGTAVLVGTNLDDLGEFRPGLRAAEEAGARHPYVEAAMGKADIRRLARRMNLEFSELPASPCLASRLYTGTRVTDERLAAVELAEELIRSATRLPVVRCRIKGYEMLIETTSDGARLMTPRLLQRVEAALAEARLPVNSVCVDGLPYAPGRAFQRLS